MSCIILRKVPGYYTIVDKVVVPPSSSKSAPEDCANGGVVYAPETSRGLSRVKQEAVGKICLLCLHAAKMTPKSMAHG